MGFGPPAISAMNKHLITAICHHFDIPLGRCERVTQTESGWPHRSGTVAWSYDGKVLDIEARYEGFMGSRPDSDAMHDIAHHLCAARSRHKLPEWGLGAGVDDHSREAPLRVRLNYAVDEESMASLLGIMMEKAAGLDWSVAWDQHNWEGEPLGHLVGKRRELEAWMKKRGLLVRDILSAVRDLRLSPQVSAS